MKYDLNIKPKTKLEMSYERIKNKICKSKGEKTRKRASLGS